MRKRTLNQILLGLLMLSLHGCSSEPEKATPTPISQDAGESDLADVGPPNDASGTDATVVPTSCEELGFTAAGGACDTCELTCDCPDGFPISIAHCTDDGCLSGADCAAVCLAGLEFAFDCTNVYSAPLADGEVCTSRSECASSNCIAGRCARLQTQWSRAFHTSPIAGELRNKVEVEALAVDDFGVRAAIYSKLGSSLDGTVSTVGRIVGLDRTGEVRFNTGLPGDHVSALHVVEDDSLVAMRFSRELSLGGETFTPDGDDDWYVARVPTAPRSSIVWSKHLVSSTIGAAAVLVGDVYVVAYFRAPAEFVVAGYAVADGAVRWETVLPAAGFSQVSASAVGSDTALVTAATSGPGTFGDSSVTGSGTVFVSVDTSNGDVTTTVIEERLALLGTGADGTIYFDANGYPVQVSWIGGALGAVEPLEHLSSDVASGGVYTGAIVTDGWATEELAPGVIQIGPTGEVWWVDALLPRLSKVAVAEDGTIYLGAAGSGVRIDGERFSAPGPIEQRASLFFFAIGPTR